MVPCLPKPLKELKHKLTCIKKKIFKAILSCEKYFLHSWLPIPVIQKAQQSAYIKLGKTQIALPILQMCIQCQISVCPSYLLCGYIENCTYKFAYVIYNFIFWATLGFRSTLPWSVGYGILEVNYNFVNEDSS